MAGALRRRVGKDAIERYAKRSRSGNHPAHPPSLVSRFSSSSSRISWQLHSGCWCVDFAKLDPLPKPLI